MCFIFAQNNFNYMKDISQQDWAQGITNANVVILDVRASYEFDEGHIPGAKNIDIYLGQDFINELEVLDKNKDYYVYCKSGGRSGQACAIMKQLGFTKVYNLIGGITEWQGEVIY